MKLNNIKQVDKFLEILNKIHGEVWIEVKDLNSGKVTMTLDLSSYLSRYVALGELINASKNPNSYTDLELYCQSSEDQALFYSFFNENKDTL